MDTSSWPKHGSARSRPKSSPNPRIGCGNDCGEYVQPRQTSTPFCTSGLIGRSVGLNLGYGYRRPPPKIPIDQRPRPHPASSGWSARLTATAARRPKSPQASALAPIRLRSRPFHRIVRPPFPCLIQSTGFRNAERNANASARGKDARLGNCKGEWGSLCAAVKAFCSLSRSGRALS